MPHYKLRHTDGATIWLDEGRADLELADTTVAIPSTREIRVSKRRDAKPKPVVKKTKVK